MRTALAVLLALALATPLAAQPRAEPRDEYDELFRKYSKRFFGPGFDWRYFKAQGMAESNLRARARSAVGARGIMQLMPSTYGEIRTRNPELRTIDDPESNIAAGILYDRQLWNRYEDHAEREERLRFMFGGYNAGPGTMLRAKRVARERRLDDYRWSSVVEVAPHVPRWRWRETLGYVARIEDNYRTLAADSAAIPGPRRPRWRPID